MSYWRFAAMIATSTVVMFGLMYINTYLITHVFFSETRTYMAILMGAVMAIIMLSFMLSMYSNKKINAAIFIGSLLVFAIALWLVRSQVTVADTSYMRAMIPHHSIAIMTSTRANIEDSRVRKLADEIIYAQDKEIAEMRYLIAEIEANGPRQESEPEPPAEVMSLQQALSTPKTATMDAGFMRAEDITQVFPEGAACAFRYTTDSPPVLAVGETGEGLAALVKLDGDLVRLSQGESAEARVWSAPGIEARLSAVEEDDALGEDDDEEAELVLRLEQGLEAGYRGFYGCST
ncbi:DUF305 domain-containing protein [Pseudohoeflea coraliihabitans]|uniref:DUF305 domain-containing protein n=1 Tax=Pseudohoeflea coraliihabitans TaxID=2860393 RepID=A0ABS6WU71_9HYPH|nr:DUF305 domain-containing protein [Pseudohoeflea sp. DP4N28-3]MBW3098982.1 DUF305 domain-containing protein [Pseudohoeflea sp. DP4N28-3]